MLKKKTGFTLVELLVVVAIIAILVTIVIIAINPRTVIQQTNDTKKRSEMNQIKTALQLYFNDNNSYPAAPSFLVPTYSRQLPDTASDTSFAYAASGVDYDARVALDQPGVDDDGTVDACATNDPNGDLTSGASTGRDYMICPD